MINGKSITLYSIAWGKYLDPAKKVLDHCNNTFPFFDKIVLNTNIDNEKELNRFLVESLTFDISTDYVLIVQSDGFIINPQKWKDCFLNYDYIGAPWPWHNVVGNGGFCLRSKKFLDLSSKLVYDSTHPEYHYCPEDYFLCVLNRNYFIDNNCLFPSLETALSFSFEHPIPGINKNMKDSFGFHGKHNSI
jgi:hypothetical protein